MNELGVQGLDRTTCPKRLWVMLTLSDDELMEGGETPMQGLQFHLSRCESCRSFAERLLAVSADMRSLAELEPASALADRADAQLRRAIREGARSTGRVTIPDEPDAGTEPRARHGAPSTSGRADLWKFMIPRGQKPAAWARYTRYAAAAMVVLAATLFVFWRGVSANRNLQFARAPARAEEHRSAPAGLSIEAPLGGKGEHRVARRGPPDASPQAEVRKLKKAVLDRDDADGAVADSITHDSVAGAGVGRLASVSAAEGTVGARRTAGRRVRYLCLHHSHIEAALCEQANGFHRAVILPASEKREWGRRSAFGGLDGRRE